MGFISPLSTISLAFGCDTEVCFVSVGVTLTTSDLVSSDGVTGVATFISSAIATELNIIKNEIKIPITNEIVRFIVLFSIEIYTFGVAPEITPISIDRFPEKLSEII
jgi:hypothetical protein